MQENWFDSGICKMAAILSHSSYFVDIKTDSFVI